MILVYDGECGLCNRVVQWVLTHDPDGPMRFASRTGRTGQMILRRLEGMSEVDSVILVHRSGAWIKSTAILELARYVGGGYALLTAGYVIPRRLRDWWYDAVARRRSSIAGACVGHAGQHADRFLP